MRLILSLAIATLWFNTVVIAQEAGQATEPKMETWIEMLDSHRFSDRVEASEKLHRLGVAAIEDLERAAIRGGTEAAGRAFEILKRHHSSDDPILKAAAADVLGRIADQVEHPKSKAAQRTLQPAPPQARNAAPMPIPIFNFPQPVNRRIAIQVKITNGDKDVTVEENGKKVRVIENADGIQVEKHDGNGGITKKKFKDLAELKQKDAEAHHAYQRAIGGRGGAVNPRNLPGIPAVPGVQQLAPQAMILDEIAKKHEEIRKQDEEIRKQHLEMIERLRQAQPLPPVVPVPSKTTETKNPFEV